jgi:ribosome-interacting GTPase 1
MAKTQKNKNTANHLGLLKARLAKLRRELITPKGSGGGPAAEGIEVYKHCWFIEKFIRIEKDIYT